MLKTWSKFVFNPLFLFSENQQNLVLPLHKWLLLSSCWLRILENQSGNGRTLSHYTGECSEQSLLIQIMVLKCMFLCATWQSISTAGETLRTKLENGIIFTLGRYGESCKESSILKQMADKCEKWCNSGMPHPTYVCVLCGCSGWHMWHW